MALQSSHAYDRAFAKPLSMKGLLDNGRKCRVVRSANHKSDLDAIMFQEEEYFLPSSSSSSWVSDFQSLPEVPIFYPIERTSTVVSCHDPLGITERILGCLRTLSITAKFNSNEAALFASTIDYVRFYVRLYKATDNKGVLVELQRVDGYSFAFVKYAKAILASARGELSDEKKAAMKKQSSLNYIPASVLPCPHEDSNDACMMHIEELLKNDNSDAMILGVESLLLLTDRDRSACPISAAEAVLGGNGHSVCGDVVLKCIRCPRPALSPTGYDFDYASRQYETMHSTALAVLGNSLETACDAECPILRSLFRSKEWMGQFGMIDVLVSVLRRAEDCTHSAYHAVRCLNALLGSSSEMKRALVDRGLKNTIKESQSVGRRRHSLLAQECDASLALMANK